MDREAVQMLACWLTALGADWQADWLHPASRPRKCLLSAVLGCMFPWRTRYP